MRAWRASAERMRRDGTGLSRGVGYCECEEREARECESDGVGETSREARPKKEEERGVGEKSARERAEAEMRKGCAGVQSVGGLDSTKAECYTLGQVDVRGGLGVRLVKHGGPVIMFVAIEKNSLFQRRGGTRWFIILEDSTGESVLRLSARRRSVRQHASMLFREEF
nr:hypothetical protein Iba_chr03eCG0850 [Ipomoea batatas]